MALTGSPGSDRKAARSYKSLESVRQHLLASAASVQLRGRFATSVRRLKNCVFIRTDGEPELKTVKSGQP